MRRMMGLVARLAGAWCEPDLPGARAGGVFFPDDQAVPLHAVQGIGARGLFQVETLQQIALGYPVFLPEREQDRKLPEGASVFTAPWRTGGQPVL